MKLRTAVFLLVLSSAHVSRAANVDEPNPIGAAVTSGKASLTDDQEHAAHVDVFRWKSGYETADGIAFYFLFATDERDFSGRLACDQVDWSRLRHSTSLPTDHPCRLQIRRNGQKYDVPWGYAIGVSIGAKTLSIRLDGEQDVVATDGATLHVSFDAVIGTVTFVETHYDIIGNPLAGGCSCSGMGFPGFPMHG